MDSGTTIKVKSTHPSQGDFVIIEKVDYDPAKHELYDPKDAEPVPSKRGRTKKVEE